MSKSGWRFVVAALLPLVLIATACGDDDDEDTTQVENDAIVDIVAPADGATVDEDIPVTVTVTDFTVVNKLGQPAVAGEGHIHFYIDATPLPTEQGKPAVTADQKTYHAASTTLYTWSDVPAGQHTLGVQLVNNDHTPLNPPITDTITVTVR